MSGCMGLSDSDIARLGPRARAIIAAGDPKPKGKKRRAPRADKAPLLLHALRALAPDLQRPVPEYRFAKPRLWRFDWAWPDRMVAAEVDGGRWKPGGGRHGSDADYEKLNAARVAGWLVLRFTVSMLTDGPAACVEQVRAALEGRDG